MDIFRQRCRSEETLSHSELHNGRIVWVEGSDGREERVWSNNSLMTLEEYRKLKETRAAENRKRFNPKFEKGRRRHTVHPSYPGSLVPGNAV